MPAPAGCCGGSGFYRSDAGRDASQAHRRQPRHKAAGAGDGASGRCPNSLARCLDDTDNASAPAVVVLADPLISSAPAARTVGQPSMARPLSAAAVVLHADPDFVGRRPLPVLCQLNPSQQTIAADGSGALPHNAGAAINTAPTSGPGLSTTWPDFHGPIHGPTHGPTHGPPDMARHMASMARHMALFMANDLHAEAEQLVKSGLPKRSPPKKVLTRMKDFVSRAARIWLPLARTWARKRQASRWPQKSRPKGARMMGKAPICYRARRHRHPHPFRRLPSRMAVPPHRLAI